MFGIILRTTKGMEQLIAYGSIENLPLYNCSDHTLEEWAELQSRPNVKLGILHVTYGVMIEILYIPCLAVMLKKDYFKHSCFKIMSFLGLVDMGNIVANSILHGSWLIKGVFFCQYPTFLYVSGSYVVGIWACECMTALLLASNRVLDIVWNKKYDFIFEGRPIERTEQPESEVPETGLVHLAPISPPFLAIFTHQIFIQTFLICAVNLFASTAYVFVQFFSVPPWFGIAVHTCWQLGTGVPVFFYFMINKTIRDEIFGFFKKILYIPCLAVMMKKEYFKHSCFKIMVFLGLIDMCNIGQFTHNIFPGTLLVQILLQTSLICAANLSASITYVFVQFVPVPAWFGMAAHASWQLGSGFPVLVYLMINKTIRSEIYGCFKKVTSGGVWTSECMTALMLAAQRVLDLVWAKKVDFLFGG
ncbi:unnamed protein product [Caenorhabditis auriculariae]|uniref:Uncharacterized protein n=1 Tax=Caenorhabditis auriculariae TaxID=2777116 RepID=A0A8S1HIZ3_9PELO|nr:unnamed protein product [Caenorhabditis auriculariae]